MGSLFRDLIDRKLWPLALLLVAACAAVPFVLKSSAEPAAPAPGAAATGGNAAASIAEPAVAVATGSDRAGRREVIGKRKDPFRPAEEVLAEAREAERKLEAGRKAATQTGAPGTAAITGGGTAADKSSTATGGSTSTTGTSTTTTTTTDGDKDEPKELTYYAVDVRITGDNGRDLIENVPRLSPLPDSSAPLLVYMGLLSDHKTGVLLVSSDVKVISDGACKPSRTLCERVHLTEGDTMVFELAGDGDVLQYELNFLAIHKRTTSSATVARKAYSRTSKSGRRVVATQEDRLGGLRFSKKTGLLKYPKKGSKAAKAEAARVKSQLRLARASKLAPAPALTPDGSGVPDLSALPLG